MVVEVAQKTVQLTQEFMDWLELHKPGAFYWLRKHHVESACLSREDQHLLVRFPETPIPDEPEQMDDFQLDPNGCLMIDEMLAAHPYWKTYFVL